MYFLTASILLFESELLYAALLGADAEPISVILIVPPLSKAFLILATNSCVFCWMIFVVPSDKNVSKNVCTCSV